MPSTRIKIVGVPLDLGQRRRGVDMGPSALRAAFLQRQLQTLGHEVEDAGNLSVVIPETQQVRDDRVRYIEEIADVCRAVSERAHRFVGEGAFPLLVGGDHSIAVGTAAGVARAYRAQGPEIGLIWIDAHADMHTPETTATGNVHGMGLACIVGHGPAPLVNLNGPGPILEPKNVALIGARSIDVREKENVRRAGIHVFTMREIDEHGIRGVIDRAIDAVSDGTSGFHVSLDMDFLDPSEAPGVGTPCPGGATYREAH